MTAPADRDQHAGPIGPAARFPLIPRPKPPGRALHLRIDEIGNLARSAAEAYPDDSRLTHAAEALNKAALIASDCGMPELARRLCWEQYDRFAAVAPLGYKAAKLALQPLVNIGRLAARGGATDRAYQIYESIYRSVRSYHPAVIDDRVVDLGLLCDTPETGRELRKFCWTILLADGTRALAHSRRWHDALAHLAQHKGIGRRMLDGRQIAILARTVLGHTAEALTLLNGSRPEQLWEHAVLACLRTLYLHAARRRAGTAADVMVQTYLRLRIESGSSLFTVRLGLSVTELAASPSQQEQVVHKVLHDALHFAEGHSAAETLSSTPCRSAMTATEIQHLNDVVRESGLHQATLSAELLDQLLATATSSSHQLTALLTRRNTDVEHG